MKESSNEQITPLEMMVLEVGVEPTCPVKGAGF